MAWSWRVPIRIVILSGLILGGTALFLLPEQAPALVAFGLAATAGPFWRAWRGSRGTALRSAVVWAVVAVGFSLIAQVLGALETVQSGRPMAGHWVYLSTLATLASLISVLNARTPGGGAWAVLMLLLVLVFFIPWLEAPGIARHARGLERLRLDTPWTIFYWLLVLAGVTNYWPTRYGPAAACLGGGFLLEYLALTHWKVRLSAGMIWPAFSWTLTLAIGTADWRSRSVPRASSRLEAVWFWFRDHWGVVWALRVQDRFNRSAEAQRWPIRLGWHGVVPAQGLDLGASLAIPEAAEATLRGLLRRFADPARVDEAVAGTCQGLGPA